MSTKHEYIISFEPSPYCTLKEEWDIIRFINKLMVRKRLYPVRDFGDYIRSLRDPIVGWFDGRTVRDIWGKVDLFVRKKGYGRIKILKVR